MIPKKKTRENRGILCLEFSRHPVIIDTTCKTIIRGAMQPSQNIEPQLIKERKVLHPQFDIIPQSIQWTRYYKRTSFACWFTNLNLSTLKLDPR